MTLQMSVIIFDNPLYFTESRPYSNEALFASSRSGESIFALQLIKE
jgi:hypothetical protein